MLCVLCDSVDLHELKFSRHINAVCGRRNVLIELQYYFVDPAQLFNAQTQQQQQVSSGNRGGIAMYRQDSQQRSASWQNGGLLNTGRVSRGNGRGDQYDERAIRLKLQPYLDGRTPLCDILWLEDLAEDAVWAVVRKSPNIIVNIRPARG